MQSKSRHHLLIKFIVASLNLLLLIGLSEAGTVLGAPKLKQDQHASDTGAKAFEPISISQSLRVLHTSSKLSVAEAAAVDVSHPANINVRSSSRGLARDPYRTDAVTGVPVEVLEHFSSWNEKVQSRSALFATASVHPAGSSTTTSSSSSSSSSSSNSSSSVSYVSSLETADADDSSSETVYVYQPLRVQARTWFQQLLQDLDEDLDRQDKQLSRLRNHGRARQPKDSASEANEFHRHKHVPDSNYERHGHSRDQDQEPSTQHDQQQGAHHDHQDAPNDWPEPQQNQEQHSHGYEHHSEGPPQHEVVYQVPGPSNHDHTDAPGSHQLEHHQSQQHDDQWGEHPPAPEAENPDQQQLDDDTLPQHSQQHQAPDRDDGMYADTDMPQPQAREQHRRGWAPTRAFVPPIPQQYRPPDGDHGAGRWDQGVDSYSSWVETACFQEVRRSDCKVTGSGAAGSPIQLLQYRSQLGCCQGPDSHSALSQPFNFGLATLARSMRRPAGSAVRPMQSPAAAKTPGDNSVHAILSQDPGAAAAGPTSTVATTAAAAVAAAAVPSLDDWSWSYSGFRPEGPGANELAGCVWSITQLDVKPADSSFFAQRIANATGVCRFGNAWQQCSGPLCAGLTATIHAYIFDTYAVSRHPGTQADLDTSCEDYLHSSSSTLAATPRRKRAAKVGRNRTQTPAQKQNQQRTASNHAEHPLAHDATFIPAADATSMAPAAQQHVAQTVANTTIGPATQPTAGAQLAATTTSDDTTYITKGRKLLESYAPEPRDNGDDDGYDEEEEEEETGLDAVLANTRRRHARSGFFGGRALIITGHITSLTGPPHSHIFKGGLVEHVSRFSQALPLSKAEYGLLPTDVPEIIPGSYKYVLYKR